MLRNVLMSIGFLVAVLPYVGIPYDVTKWIWTSLGLFLMILVFFSQHTKRRESVVVLEEEPIGGDRPRELDVQRHEDTIRPEVHVEDVIAMNETRSEDVAAFADGVTEKSKRKRTKHTPITREETPLSR